MNKFFNRWPSELLCLFMGAILTLAFAPFEIFPIAVLSPMVLLAGWLNTSARRAFWLGWLFGLGFFTTGVYWVYISINQFGGAPVWLSSLITLLFVAILALFPAINGYLLNRYFPQKHAIKIIYAFPALWVFLEWVRSWIFTGFPWLFLGDSQIDSPLKGYAPIFSVYGVSLAVTLSSALLLSAILAFKNKKMKRVYFYLLGFAFIWILGSALSTLSFTKPVDKPIKTSLVQGNIPQDLKWAPEHLQYTLNTYKSLTEQHWDSRMIIWPEAAIPEPLQNAENYVYHMAELATRNHSLVITGIFIKAPSTNEYYNTMITLGHGSGVYVKERLVPFGEYTPMKRFFGKLLVFLDIPMSDVVAATKNPFPLKVNNTSIATFLCYEIAYPELVLLHDGKVGLLLTATNDAWFGHSIAQAQHLAMARMRSLETGRPGLFVGNTGITAFILPDGKIQAMAPAFEETVLTDTIQPMQGKTPWMRFHMDPLLLILLIMLFGGKIIYNRVIE